MPKELTLLLLLGAGLACAQSITIQNNSFETATLPISANGGGICNIIANSTLYPFSGTLANWTGLSTTSSAGAGAGSGPLTPSTFTFAWGSGNNLGYVQVAAAGSASLSQVLAATLQNTTTYTLTAKFGNPALTSLNGIPVRFNYSLQLWAGSTMLAAASNLALAPDTAGTDTLTYFSGNTPLAGQPLMVVIATTGGNGAITEAFFDDIALAATPGQPVTNILPQLAYGGGWYTELYFANLNTNPVSFPVNFIGDNGNALTVPGVNASSTTVNLQPGGAGVVEVPNTGPLLDGYVAVSLPSGVTAYGIFRSSSPGINPQEAVVPLSGVSATSSSFVFDETSYVTGVALVNVSSAASTITAIARDANGNTIGTASIPLPPNGKTALRLRDIPGFSGVVGTLGTVNFSVSSGNIAALGLRFNGSAFTSIPTSDR